MKNRETLFVLTITLTFLLLVHGDFSRRSMQKLADNGVVKTFKTETNDIIDCVDVFKQPAFNNPLLKNHVLQWRPTTLPIELNNQSSFERSTPEKSIPEYYTCPVNTIPIRRPITKSSNDNSSSIENDDLLYRFALLKMIRYPDDMFKGAFTYININRPRVEPGQNSGASIWICSDSSNKKDCIKAGWMVYPEIYGDSRSRFSIYWTSDDFHQTGCYDLLCGGFVQVHRSVNLGSPYTYIATRGDPHQFNPFYYIFQDATTQHWWLVMGSEYDRFYAGYWPKEIVPRLSQGGTVLHFGGSVMTRAGQEFPPMGDGYIPDGEMRDSNYFKRIHYVNNSNYLVPPRTLGAKVFTDNPKCYDLIYEEDGGKDYGRVLLMGGPGGKC